MQNTQSSWERLLFAEKKAHARKWQKILKSPFRYPMLLAFNKIVYPLTKREWFKKVTPFFGVPMTIAMPSGTDILLNGIKSHDSEIRLSKFLAKQLKPGDIFIDVGAHHGYYSLLASAQVHESGQVYSIEATKHSFDLLFQNTFGHPTIKVFHNAAGDSKGEITFYEYPGPYAEYNTMIKGAYDNAKWRNKVKETVTRVDTIVLDQLMRENQINKAIIKIDVEGGEYAVLKGLHQSIQQGLFTIIIEYLFSPDKNNPHHQAVNFLKENGYTPYCINAVGDAEILNDIDEYMQKHALTSDNIVFRRAGA